MSLESLMDGLVRARAAVRPADLDGWWRAHEEVDGDVPFDRAVRAGSRFDMLGWAFASGYSEALRALAPGLGEERAALAVTEEGGNHPRAITATLEPAEGGWRLTGQKVFVTFGTWARSLLVLARHGEELALVVVPASRSGVRLEPGPPLSMAPEIPHARVRFDGVLVHADERLPGDGWADWVRPFRTVEDLHVLGAALGMLLGVGARAGWPGPLRERGLCRVASLRTLALSDPGDPTVHLALAGAISEIELLVRDLDAAWASAPAEVASAFQRDRALLRVASSARAKRTARAWERLEGA